MLWIKVIMPFYFYDITYFTKTSPHMSKHWRAFGYRSFSKSFPLWFLRYMYETRFLGWAPVPCYNPMHLWTIYCFRYWLVVWTNDDVLIGSRQIDFSTFWSKSKHLHWSKSIENGVCKLSVILSRPQCAILPRCHACLYYPTNLSSSANLAWTVLENQNGQKWACWCHGAVSC